MYGSRIEPLGTPNASGPVAFAAPDVSPDDIEAVLAVLRSGWLTTGDVCAGLERDLGEYLGVPHVVALSSCTAALEISFASLRLRPGARVGVPTWTFVASALAPARYGATPVLLDVERDTLNLSASSLEAAIVDGLDAVVVVHFGGVPVDARVHDLCAEAGLPVVEDAAHALGALDHRGRVAGAGSYAACYSFYATKNLTAGEGGALATDNEELADFARSFRLHGLSHHATGRYRSGNTSDYDLLFPGIKANLPDLLAALARSQLGRYDRMQSSRRELVQRYRAHLDELRVRAIPTSADPGSADHLMVVELPRHVAREAVIRALALRGIGTSVHFRPLHTFAWVREHGQIGPSGVSAADELSRRVMSLPLHSGMTVSDVDFVCASLAEALADEPSARER